MSVVQVFPCKGLELVVTTVWHFADILLFLSFEALISVAVSLFFWFVGTFIVLVAFQLGWFSAPTVERCFIPYIGFLLLGADNHALQSKKIHQSAAVWL